jgi:m7GpppX diphosphatase
MIVSNVQALKRRYGIREDMLRVYVHYQPSYYHLHVHFLHIKLDAGHGMAAGKAHLLLDIIGEGPVIGRALVEWFRCVVYHLNIK